TGLVADAYFSGTKIWWLLKNVNDVRENAREGRLLFGTMDSWVIWNLTRGSKDVLTPELGGAHITDYSNASRTMLFNIHKLNWDNELLEIQGDVPQIALPLPRPSSDKEIYGYVGPEISKLLGDTDVPVSGDIGDQQAALFGQACFNIGEIKSTYGTGNFILMNTGDEPVKASTNLLSTVFYSTEEGRAKYALEGSIFITGGAVQWLKDSLRLISDPEEIERLARDIKDSGGVYFVPAFAGLAAPYWDQYARGLIIGLTGGTGRQHIARAILESIAYLNMDVIETMTREVGNSAQKVKVDGGAATNDFLMQFQADITGMKILRPLSLETTSQGAGYLAGLAVGFWSSLDELRGNWKLEREFLPKMESEMRDRLYNGWKAAVRRSLGWAKEVPWE
ncbi:MAG: glycerol kinase GlpK, partial [Conexivisphaerales archaeon]